MGVNYGLNRVRFTAPVPSGSRVRARFTLHEVRDDRRQRRPGHLEHGGRARRRGQAGPGRRMDRAALLLMMRRWKKQNPPGSNWGEFGPDDQRGRMNYVTREKVLQGIAEVKEGITFCLSLPLDYPGGSVLNPRRKPAAHRRHAARQERRQAELLLPARRRQPGPHRRGVRRRGAADAAVLDAVGLVRARRQPLRRRRRRQGRDRVLQRLSRGRARCSRRREEVAEGWDRYEGTEAQGARHPEPRRARRAGPRRDDRPAPSFRPRAPRRSATTS